MANQRRTRYAPVGNCPHHAEGPVLRRSTCGPFFFLHYQSVERRCVDLHTRPGWATTHCIQSPSPQCLGINRNAKGRERFPFKRSRMQWRCGSATYCRNQRSIAVFLSEQPGTRSAWCSLIHAQRTCRPSQIQDRLEQLCCRRVYRHFHRFELVHDAADRHICKPCFVKLDVGIHPV